MFIYVDESGSFVPATAINSWNVVAAYVVPEIYRRNIEKILQELKLSLGRVWSDEVKLKDISESQLKQLLTKLARTEATLFVSGIDLGSQAPATILHHQQSQIERILENKPRMFHEEGRELIQDLADRVKRLPLQLYTQLVTQIDLLDQVYRSSTLYYAQRIPPTLGSFRWRIDEKNSNKPLFEETMRYMAPPLLQAKTLHKPAIFVEGFDYSHYERAFKYQQSEIPTYLQKATGVDIRSASNLGKVLRDFSFVRSHDVLGVQVADLLASAYRRTLRDEFNDTLGVAKLLGALTVQRAKGDPSIHLITLSGEQYASGHVFEVAQLAKAAARQMFK